MAHAHQASLKVARGGNRRSALVQGMAPSGGDIGGDRIDREADVTDGGPKAAQAAIHRNADPRRLLHNSITPSGDLQDGIGEGPDGEGGNEQIESLTEVVNGTGGVEDGDAEAVEVTRQG